MHAVLRDKLKVTNEDRDTQCKLPMIKSKSYNFCISKKCRSRKPYFLCNLEVHTEK